MNTQPLGSHGLYLASDHQFTPYGKGCMLCGQTERYHINPTVTLPYPTGQDR